MAPNFICKLIRDISIKLFRKGTMMVVKSVERKVVLMVERMAVKTDVAWVVSLVGLRVVPSVAEGLDVGRVDGWRDG